MTNLIAFITTLTLSILLLSSSSTTTVSSLSTVAKDEVACTMCDGCENPCQPLPPPPPVIECPPPPVVERPPPSPPPPPPAVVECPPPPAPSCPDGCQTLPPPPPPQLPPCQFNCRPPSCPGNCNPPPVPPMPWMTPGVTFPYQLADDENDTGTVKLFAAFGLPMQSLISMGFLCLSYYYLFI